MTERSPECWVCEAILLDWVVLGIRALEVLRGAVLKHCEHCPHTNDTDLGTLWRFNTWNLAASSSFKTTCAVSSRACNLIHLQCRSKISNEDSFSHAFKQLRKTECTFHVYHVGPFTDAWHSAPMLWGHKYGKINFVAEQRAVASD